MALLRIHNVTDSPVHLGDFYTAVPAHGQITVTRPVAFLHRLPSVRRAMAADQVAIGVTLSPGEALPENVVNPFEARK